MLNIEVKEILSLEDGTKVAIWDKVPSRMGKGVVPTIVGNQFLHDGKLYLVDEAYIVDSIDSSGFSVRMHISEIEKQITPDEYLKGVLLTESVDFKAIAERLSKKKLIRLLHGAKGLCTESGEFMDMLKKHIFYGKPLDEVNLAEEIGDQFWYIGIILDELGLTFEEVMDKNNKKLMARYNKKKFTAEDAENRDLEKERKILEGK